MLIPPLRNEGIETPDGALNTIWTFHREVADLPRCERGSWAGQSRMSLARHQRKLLSNCSGRCATTPSTLTNTNRFSGRYWPRRPSGHDRKEVPALGVPAQRHRAQAAANRWGTIRYAIDSTPRTIRLCVILLVTTGVPSSVILVLLHHYGIVG